MLRYINYIAVFILGATATLLTPHIAHILVGFMYPEQKEATVSGIIASFPYNLIALVFFLASLAFVIGYSRKQVSQDKGLREDIRELITEIKLD